jgi:hypothetical protein
MTTPSKIRAREVAQPGLERAFENALPARPLFSLL